MQAMMECIVSEASTVCNAGVLAILIVVGLTLDSRSEDQTPVLCARLQRGLEVAETQTWSWSMSLQQEDC